MGTGSSKAKADSKPHLSRPSVILDGHPGEYVLAPMDVAREKELKAANPAAAIENAGPVSYQIHKMPSKDGALLRPDLWRHVFDDLTDDEFAELVHQRAARSPAFAARFGLASTFQQAATPLPESAPEPAPVCSISLPDEAPRLWADRDPGTKATQFVRETYAPWIEAGVLTGTALKCLDPVLYQAYHVRISRKPDEAVSLVTRNPFGRLDDAEAARRHRESVKASKAKAKARERDNLSHIPS